MELIDPKAYFQAYVFFVASIVVVYYSTMRVERASFNFDMLETHARSLQDQAHHAVNVMRKSSADDRMLLGQLELRIGASKGTGPPAAIHMAISQGHCSGAAAELNVWQSATANSDLKSPSIEEILSTVGSHLNSIDLSTTADVQHLFEVNCTLVEELVRSRPKRYQLLALKSNLLEEEFGRHRHTSSYSYPGHYHMEVRVLLVPSVTATAQQKVPGTCMFFEALGPVCSLPEKSSQQDVNDAVVSALALYLGLGDRGFTEGSMSVLKTFLESHHADRCIKSIVALRSVLESLAGMPLPESVKDIYDNLSSALEAADILRASVLAAELQHHPLLMPHVYIAFEQKVALHIPFFIPFLMTLLIGIRRLRQVDVKRERTEMLAANSAEQEAGN